MNPGTMLARMGPLHNAYHHRSFRYGEIRGHVAPGRTMKEKVDPITGKGSKVVTEYKDADIRPRVSIKDDSRQDGQTDHERRVWHATCCRWERSSPSVMKAIR